MLSSSDAPSRGGPTALAAGAESLLRSLEAFCGGGVLVPWSPTGRSNSVDPGWMKACRGRRGRTDTDTTNQMATRDGGKWQQRRIPLICCLGALTDCVGTLANAQDANYTTYLAAVHPLEVLAGQRHSVEPIRVAPARDALGEERRCPPAKSPTTTRTIINHNQRLPKQHVLFFGGRERGWLPVAKTDVHHCVHHEENKKMESGRL